MTRVKRVATPASVVVAVLGAAAALAVGLSLGTPARGLWRRVFYDDFRHGLQRSRWGTYAGEPGGDPAGWWSPSHAVVAHGVLNLETYRDPRYGGRWVSAGVSSAPGLRQTYGKYELRVRMDPGKGVAFVALLWPARNVWPPEIDFAEDGGETSARNHVTATLHYGAQNRQIQRTLSVNLTRWHTIGVQWLPGTLIYTIDGRRWATVSSPAVPDQPMEMDVQTQAGTCGDPYAPCPDSRTPAHVNAQIRWVAAYAYAGRRSRH